MTRQMIAPDATVTTTRRAKFWQRVQQTMRAALVLRDKGVHEFRIHDLLGEINERLGDGVVRPACLALVEKGLFEYADQKKRNRRLRIVDATRFQIILGALERGSETMQEHFQDSRHNMPYQGEGREPATPEWLAAGAQRVVEPVPVARSHMRWLGRGKRIEAKLDALNDKVDRLLAMWEDE